jgi:AraC-like DNA-binding protein
MIRASGSIALAHDPLRDRAIDDLDELIAAAADARKALRSYQTVLEKNRRHLAEDRRASDMAARFDVRAVRAALTDQLDRVERARGASRRSLWRLQASEGTTIAEIARMWGLSRQLISRALRAEDR